MVDLAAVIRTVRAGRGVAPRHWQALYESDQQSVVPILIDELERLPTPTQRRQILLGLLQYGDTPERVEQLCEGDRAYRIMMVLRREPIPSYDPLSLDSAPYLNAIYQAKLTYDAFVELVERLASAAAQPAREILAGPPLPVSCLFEVNGSYGTILTIFGPKWTAAEVVGQWGHIGDVELLRRVVENVRESAWNRVAAAVTWHRFAGAEAVPPIMDLCFDPDLDDLDTYPTYARHLARIGPDLIPCLIRRLADPSYTDRYHAVEILVALGKAAVEPLVEVVANSDIWQTRRNAEDALARIDRRALRRANQQRRAAGRRISIVRPDAPQSDRGISRAEPPDAH